jgi:nicotinamide N-methyltransferase
MLCQSCSSSLSIDFYFSPIHTPAPAFDPLSPHRQTNLNQGHHLWNAGRTTSTYFEQHPSLLSQKSVLELGAGAGLPSLVSALLGARRVVVTDYPDADLITNLSTNITSTSLPSSVIVAEGYLWGAPTDNLVKHLPEGEQGFDVLILADLLFNHSEHAKLIDTVRRTLKKTAEAKAYVFFSPYRPWLLSKDLAFFEDAAKAGFRVEKTFEKVMEKVMFEDDPGVSYSSFGGGGVTVLMRA